MSPQSAICSPQQQLFCQLFVALVALVALVSIVSIVSVVSVVSVVMSRRGALVPEAEATAVFPGTGMVKGGLSEVLKL